MPAKKHSKTKKALRKTPVKKAPVATHHHLTKKLRDKYSLGGVVAVLLGVTLVLLLMSYFNS